MTNGDPDAGGHLHLDEDERDESDILLDLNPARATRPSRIPTTSLRRAG